jgi:hypothetical protein
VRVVVKERPPIESLRERLAGYLRALAELLAPEADCTSRILDRAEDDDEPLTEEERAALRESRSEYEHGEADSLDEVRRRVG